MAILQILKEEDNNDTLRKISRPVETITPRTLTLLDDMWDTLHHAGGVGLAAPQVGILRRIVTIEVNDGERIELINPSIVAREGTQEEAEGCLSIPDVWGITRRPQKVTVRAQNRNGKWFEISGEDLLARAFCHELDHLDGILFTDNVIRMLSDEELG